MPPKLAKLKSMKTISLSVRISEELRERLEYVKLLPGGFSGFVEKSLKSVEIDRELYKKLKKLK